MGGYDCYLYGKRDMIVIYRVKDGHVLVSRVKLEIDLMVVDRTV